MDIDAELEWNTTTLNGLKHIPDDILYTMARETLDMSVATEVIPMDTHRMKNSSVAAGVRGGSGDYYIGSYTSYASSVWNMPQESTNWTNPKSHNKWFVYTLNNHRQTIIDTAINKSWKKDML